MRSPASGRVALPCLLACACAGPVSDAPSDCPPTAAIAPSPAPPELLEPEPPDEESFPRLLGVPYPEDWQFSPDELLISAFIDPDCGVWDLQTGRLVDVVPYGYEGPCGEWFAPLNVSIVSEYSADETLTVNTSSRGHDEKGTLWVELLESDDAEAIGLRCKRCTQFLATAFAPTGHRLATLVAEPLALEIWDVDARRRIRRIALDPSEPRLGEHLAWTDDGIVLVLELDASEPCDPELDEDCWVRRGEARTDAIRLESRVWANERAGVVVDPDFYIGERPWEMSTDPWLRFVFLVVPVPESQKVDPADPTDPTDPTLELVILSPTGHTSELVWNDALEP